MYFWYLRCLAEKSSLHSSEIYKLIYFTDGRPLPPSRRHARNPSFEKHWSKACINFLISKSSSSNGERAWLYRFGVVTQSRNHRSISRPRLSIKQLVSRLQIMSYALYQIDMPLQACALYSRPTYSSGLTALLRILPSVSKDNGASVVIVGHQIRSALLIPQTRNPTHQAPRNLADLRYMNCNLRESASVTDDLSMLVLDQFDAPLCSLTDTELVSRLLFVSAHGLIHMKSR